MKRKQFTEEQIIGILKEAEAGAVVTELCRKHGMSSATYYAWKAKYGGLEVSEAKRLRALEDENGKLKRLLADDSIATIVVEHRERLARFGGEYVEAALGAQGRRLVVVYDREVDDDLVRDMTEVLTSLCARLYGRRSARRRAQRALEAAGEAA